jgi:hypothetical protein
MVQNSAELEMWKDAEKEKAKAKKQKAALKKSTGSKTNGDNMDNGEKEKDEDVPDVKTDDIPDPNHKPFFLIAQGGKQHRKVFMSKEKLGIDRVAKIKENPHPRNAVFLFDKRTKTIRLASERNFALSSRMGKNMKKGAIAVFRRIMDGQVGPDQKLTIGKSNVSNNKKQCLNINGKNVDMAPLQWWSCSKASATQKIVREDKTKKKGKADFTKSRFLIRLTGKTQRNIFMSQETQGKDFVLKIAKRPDNWRSWFIMDKRTSSVRLFTQRHLAIANLAGKNQKSGKALVMRKFSASDKSQAIQVVGHKFQNKNSKKCIGTMSDENKDNIYVNYWQCVPGKATQKWERIPVEGDYEELCKDINKGAKRWRQCPGKADKFLGLRCKRVIEKKGQNEFLVKKCGKQSW